MVIPAIFVTDHFIDWNLRSLEGIRVVLSWWNSSAGGVFEDPRYNIKVSERPSPREEQDRRQEDLLF